MLNVEILPHSADWRQVYLKIVAVYVLFLAYSMYFIFLILSPAGAKVINVEILHVGSLASFSSNPLKHHPHLWIPIGLMLCPMTTVSPS